MESEGVESKFIVCFLTVNTLPLTVIGSADAIALLEERLGEAPDIELHRADRPPASSWRAAED
jgi:hypothetical protein